MTTFRAAYFVPADGQSDVLLTSEDQAAMTDAELDAAARAEADNVGLDLSSGTLHIGEYRTSVWA